MNAQVKIKDIEETNIYNVYDIKSNTSFDYEDSDGGKCHINIYDNGVIVNRISDKHQSFIHLIKDDSYVEITTDEGKIKIDVKLVEISINNDIVIIVYQIDDIKKELEIKYF